MARTDTTQKDGPLPLSWSTKPAWDRETLLPHFYDEEAEAQPANLLTLLGQKMARSEFQGLAFLAHKPRCVVVILQPLTSEDHYGACLLDARSVGEMFSVILQRTESLQGLHCIPRPQGLQ